MYTKTNNLILNYPSPACTIIDDKSNMYAPSLVNFFFISSSKYLDMSNDCVGNFICVCTLVR